MSKTAATKASPATATAAQPGDKAVLVTTAHRGVFFGYVPGDQDLTAKTIALRSARMAIYWSSKKGLMDLCETGPRSECRISARADIPVLHDITAIFAVSDDATAKWEAA